MSWGEFLHCCTKHCVHALFVQAVPSVYMNKSHLYISHFCVLLPLAIFSCDHIPNLIANNFFVYCFVHVCVICTYNNFTYNYITCMYNTYITYLNLLSYFLVTCYDVYTVVLVMTSSRWVMLLSSRDSYSGLVTMSAELCRQAAQSRLSVDSIDPSFLTSKTQGTHCI